MGTVTDDERRQTLFVLAGGNLAQVGSRFLIGALVPLILMDFDATKADIGVAMTGMWATYALFQFPSGVVSERYGEKPLLMLGLGAASVGVVMVAIAPSLLLFGAFAVMLGAGTGLYFSPATLLSSRLFDDHGRTFSTLTAFGSSAGIVYPAVGGLIAARIGWRPAIASTGVITFAVLLLVVRVVPAAPSGSSTKRSRTDIDVRQYWRLISWPAFVYTLTVCGTLVFVFQGFVSFFPTFLVEYHGVESGFAGLVFGAVFGLSAAAQPLLGWLSDRFSRDFALGTSAVIATTGFAIVLAVPTQIGFLVGSGVLGIGISWQGVIQARVMDLFDERTRGFGFGLARTMMYLIGSLGSTVVGTLVDASGWLVGYGASAGLLGLVVLLLCINRAASFDL